MAVLKLQLGHAPGPCCRLERTLPRRRLRSRWAALLAPGPPPGDTHVVRTAHHLRAAYQQGVAPPNLQSAPTAPGLVQQGCLPPYSTTLLLWMVPGPDLDDCPAASIHFRMLMVNFN